MKGLHIEIQNGRLLMPKIELPLLFKPHHIVEQLKCNKMMCSNVYFNVLDILQLAKNCHCKIVNKNCDVDISDYDRNVGVAAIVDFWQQNCHYITNVKYNFFVLSDLIKIPKVIVHKSKNTTL